MSKDTISFLHSGDMGDLVAGLAAVKEYCYNFHKKAELWLDTTGGKQNQWCMRQSQGTGLKFNHKAFDFIRPVVEYQPYIDSVKEWTEDCGKDIKTIDKDLNDFRSCFFDRDLLKKTNQNLMFCQQIALGLEMGYKGKWLFLPQDKMDRIDVLAARSNRYHSSDQIFLINRKDLAERGGFIGTDLEYESFFDCVSVYPKRYQVKDALEAAQFIKHSAKFIVNGTLFYWLAVGMGHPNIYHELGMNIPTTYFPNQNPNTIHYVQGLSILR